MSNNNGNGRKPSPRKPIEAEVPTPIRGVEIVPTEPAMVQMAKDTMRFTPTKTVEVPPTELMVDEPHFETDVLTTAMVQEVVAEALNMGFYRTPAGYVSMKCGLDEQGEVTVSLIHWKSLNFPEQDEHVEVKLSLGALRSTKVVSGG